MMDAQKNVNQVLPTANYVPSALPYGYYPSGYLEENEVSLFDYWKVIKKHKNTIFLIVFLCTSLGIISAFVLPKKYQAEATLMPSFQSGGGGLTSMLTSISSVPGMGDMLTSLGGAGGGVQKSAQLVAFLKSRTLTEQVIEKLYLMQFFFKNRWYITEHTWIADKKGRVPTLQDAVATLQGLVKVTDDKKTSLIKIQVTMKDPIMATAIANRMLIELQDFIKNNSLTVAKRNRIFIEEQLRENKIELLEAGKKLNQFYNSNRISSVQPQLDIDIGKVLDTPQSLEEIRNSLSNLQQTKEDMNQKIEKEERSGVVSNVPSQVYLQYMILQRELLGRINTLLTQQHEMAKIEEAKEDLSFQVIDKAVLPIHPVSPKPFFNISIAFMGGLFFSIFYAFFLEYIAKMKQAEALRSDSKQISTK